MFHRHHLIIINREGEKTFQFISDEGLLSLFVGDSSTFLNDFEGEAYY